MRRLPLFPLPVVLLPRSILPLHIFEARYRRMVAHCLEFDRRFGLVFHDPDDSGPFVADDGHVGCVAEIERVQYLEDGRSLILTRGRERFRVDDGIESDAPFYEGVVEPYEDLTAPAEPDLIERRMDSLAIFQELLGSLSDPPENFPDFDPREEVSFRLASTIDTDPRWHQELLVLRDEARRLDRVDRIMEAAIGFRHEGGDGWT